MFTSQSATSNIANSHANIDLGKIHKKSKGNATWIELGLHKISLFVACWTKFFVVPCGLPNFDDDSRKCGLRGRQKGNMITECCVIICIQSLVVLVDTRACQWSGKRSGTGWKSGERERGMKKIWWIGSGRSRSGRGAVSGHYRTRCERWAEISPTCSGCRI